MHPYETQIRTQKEEIFGANYIVQVSRHKVVDLADKISIFQGLLRW